MKGQDHHRWIETHLEAAFVVSPQGLIVRTNEAAERLFDTTKARLTGRSFETLVSEDSRAAYCQAAADFASVAPRDPAQVWREVRAQRGGLPFPIELAFAAGPDGDSVAVLCRDASELEHLRDEVSGKERHFLAAAGMLLADVLQIVNLREDRLTFHGDIDRLTREPAGRFPRTLTRWVERVHPEDRERIEADMERALATGEPDWDWHYRMLAGDGSYIHLWDRGRFTIYEGETPVEGFGAVSDETQEIGKREQLEHAVSETEASQDLNEVVLSSIGEPLVVLDAAGIIKMANDRWFELVRSRGEEATAEFGEGANYLEMCVRLGMSASDAQRARQGLESVLDRSVERFQMEHGCPTPSQQQWLSTTVVPLKQQRGAVVTHADITQQVTTRETLRQTVAEVSSERRRQQAHTQYLRNEIDARFEGIAGTSRAFTASLDKVEQVAPTEATVLLQGETGTGKELLARAIHSHSSRAGRPLIRVDCSNLPSGLIESELFGHEKGAFTGASEARVGRFELAHGGTIFLDEIGELPLELQSKLLRVLEEGDFRRLGSKRERKTDVRVIVATNRDLEFEVREGRFRADLYYRLAVFPIESPPLRKRREDIPLLASLFLSRMKGSKQIHSIDPASLDRLVAYDWPGNVRELRNVVERAVILCSGGALTVDEGFDPARAATDPEQPSGLLRQDLQSVERSTILRALEESGWKIKGPGSAASRLGLSPSTLRYRIAKLGIERPKRRPGA